MRPGYDAARPGPPGRSGSGPDGPISAEEAVYALRTGTWSSGWIEADGIAPRVPVVTLRPWPARRARP